MTHVKGMLICSSLGMVLGAGVALAATSWPSEISAAQQSMQEAVTHLQTAQDLNPFPQTNNTSQVRKAMAYIELARAELDGITKAQPLPNPKAPSN